MRKGFKFLGMGLLGLLMISCGQEEATNSSNKGNVELNFVTFTGTGEDYFMNINNIAEAYHKVNPNVTIKFEKVHANEYDNTMKIRNSAKKLPDIFAGRVATMENYKNTLVPLNDLNATKINNFAKDYAIEGNIYGLPLYGYNEFVYYRKSIFNELGVEIPTTWEEFKDISIKIRDTGKYTPLALGAKDSWTTYPFNEFMPFLVSDGNDIWNQMGEDDAPFSKGKPFYTAYEKLNEYYKDKPFGEDPLGYGWDQQRAMFIAKKAAMMAAGQWFYIDLQKDLNEQDFEDIGVFVLPVRETKEDTFRYLITAETFLSIPKYSKNVKEAKEFLEWLFTSEYYKDYIQYMNVIPSVEGVEGRESIFNDAIKNIPNPEVVLQKGGNEKFRAIANYLSFDVKKMGQEMLQGVDFEKYMNDYNIKWKEAKESTN